MERTPEDRERELVKRQLARQAQLSQSANRRPLWTYALAAVCLTAALVVGTLALLGPFFTAMACAGLIIMGVAALT